MVHHRHAVGHCYRCGTIVEPRLSDQWFVRMEPLAGPALAAYRDGRLRFIPERRKSPRWARVYLKMPSFFFFLRSLAPASLPGVSTGLEMPGIGCSAPGIGAAASAFGARGF